jgi:DNA-binding NarL/FixJ family response regulator
MLEAIGAGASGYVLERCGAQGLVDAVRSVGEGDCAVSPDGVKDLLAHIRGTMPAGEPQGSEAIRSVLSQRELEIFTRLPDGESNAQIAQAMCLAENTVKNHVASILAKLHLQNRIQAAVHAVRSGVACVAGVILAPVLLQENDPIFSLLGSLLGS